MRRLGIAIFALVCFVLGALAQRGYDAHRQVKALLAARSIVPAELPPVTVSPPVPYTSIQFDREPLWAYGFDRPPQPGEKAAPRPPPSNTLQADQSVAEQTRPQHIAGSRAAFSLQQIRDGQNVVDWFRRITRRCPT